MGISSPALTEELASMLRMILPRWLLWYHQQIQMAVVASFPGPAQLFIACSMEKLYRTNSDGKLGRAWERG